MYCHDLFLLPSQLLNNMESPKDLAILGSNIKDPIIRRLFKGKGKQQEVEQNSMEIKTSNVVDDTGDHKYWIKRGLEKSAEFADKSTDLVISLSVVGRREQGADR